MRIKGYPNWFYATVITTIAMLVITGTLLAPTALVLRLDWTVPWRLATGYHIVVAAMHAAISFLVLAMIGALWSIHMRAGWKRKKSLYTGIGTLALMGMLSFTAIGIYYLGDEWSAMACSVVHICLGAALPLLFTVHHQIGRSYGARA